jgi:hypothetical protein
MTLHKEKPLEAWVLRALSSISFLDKENNNGAN